MLVKSRKSRLLVHDLARWRLLRNSIIDKLHLCCVSEFIIAPNAYPCRCAPWGSRADFTQCKAILRVLGQIDFGPRLTRNALIRGEPRYQSYEFANITASECYAMVTLVSCQGQESLEREFLSFDRGYT
jgi:hypothetical protein